MSGWSPGGISVAQAATAFPGPSPWIDITAYGAKSGQDCTTAINNAIGVALANTYGGRVFVPPGQWLTQGGHVISGGLVQIVGVGPGSRLELTANANLLRFTAPGVTTQGMLCQDLQLIGSGAGTSGTLLNIRDVNYGMDVRRVLLQNATVGVLTENFANGQFTEGVILDAVKSYGVGTFLRSLRTNGTNSHNNFEFYNCYASLGASGTFWDFGSSGGALDCYQGYINAKWNYNGAANGTGITFAVGCTIRNMLVWLRTEGVAASSLNIVLPNDSSTKMIYWGACDWGTSAASNFSIGANAVYQHHLAPPGDWGISGRPGILAVRGRNAATSDIILGAAGYSNGTPDQAGTSDLIGMVDDGQGSLSVSGLPNTRFRVGR